MLVTVIGWDIGGANTKAVMLRVKNGVIEKIRTAVEYLPLWRDHKKLALVFSTLKEELSVNEKLDCIALTLTAELSDAYQTKREGVMHVLACAEKTFMGLPLFVLDTDTKLRLLEDARQEPLKVAAANWAATGWLVSRLIKTCVVVDIGSTSTSIIPVIDGQVSAVGKTDLEKLMVGELVYTGSLRTNVAAIIDHVPVRGGIASVSSELFAQSGDVHLVLGNIKEEDYTTETADGRGKTRGEALARLSRVVCADTEMLHEDEIEGIAHYIYDAQIEQIADGLKRVYSRVGLLSIKNVPVVVTGIGKTFLGEAAAKKIGVIEIIDLEKLCFGDAFVYKKLQSPLTFNGVIKATPAFGVALMVASKLDRRLI